MINTRELAGKLRRVAGTRAGVVVVAVFALGVAAAGPAGARGVARPHAVVTHARPRLLHLTKARSRVFDVRSLGGEAPAASAVRAATSHADAPATAGSAAPATLSSFDGLDFANWGAGHPLDATGDVGPSYYVQAINSSIGIFDKASGSRVAAFTFNAFMSQGHFGNLCDTANEGEPTVLYDTFEDRWVISDFAYSVDSSGNINPQTVFQCIAVSRSGDPVNGGWNYYSILVPGGADGRPTFGVWPDGIYMSADMYGYGAGAAYAGTHVWAFDKAEMYAGAPTAQAVDFAGSTGDFSLVPANARLQTGTPPPGTPEYFVSTEDALNADAVYTLHVDWNSPSTSTFGGPTLQLAPNCFPSGTPANASTPANVLDVDALRAMPQAQYSNIGGTESVWVSHTVQRGVSANNTTCNAPTGGNATVRWYQLNLTGGTVAANAVQGATFDPELGNTFFRFTPSLAVDRAGDMAIGYTKSNAVTNPQLKYAGRLAGDPTNTLGQGEQTLINSSGSQSGSCGGATCIRWGDYSGMALDPDGCTFWMTGQYYATTGLATQTRIGDFRYPTCTTVGNGTISGTVTDGSNPIAGATVALGSRTATTDANGAYSFTVPAGTYPAISASGPGYDPSPSSEVAVAGGGTATRNFTLSSAATSGCFTDNSQNAFQQGVPNGCDLVANPGSVVLASPSPVNQQNVALGGGGFAFTTTAWGGQTFTPSVTGRLVRADIDLECVSCTTPGPSITVSLRATTGTTPVPTGGDLASGTIAGFNDNGAGGFKTVTFASPATVTAGTRYALVFRATATQTGQYGYPCSCSPDSNAYTLGQRVTSANSGTTWTADTAAAGRDLAFKVYITSGFTPSGTFVSSVKDANPAPGFTPTWTTLSFADVAPAGTAVQFQVAGSNSVYGPFTFVGPDGTSASYYTSSGADLSQFDGDRYLRYEAFLTTNNSSVTPSLSSASVCFEDTPPALSAIEVITPKKATAGKRFTVNAYALDSLGHVLTSYSDASATATDSAGELPPGTTLSFVNGHAQASLRLPTPLQSDSLSVTSGSVTGTSPSFAVLGPIAEITVSRIASATVGDPYTVKATAHDAVGNLLTGYKGAATVTDLAGGGASTAFQSGHLTVALTPSSPSMADVATVTADGVSGQSNSFKVVGPVAHLTVTVKGPFVTGVSYTVTALAEDAAGNVITDFSAEGSATDLAGAAAYPGFTRGKASFQMTPSNATSGDRVTVDAGGVSGISRGFKVVSG